VPLTGSFRACCCACSAASRGLAAAILVPSSGRGRPLEKVLECYN
jgi:hypothetical protein